MYTDGYNYRRGKEYSEKHREKKNEYNREYLKKYREDNREKINEYAREYRLRKKLNITK